MWSLVGSTAIDPIAPNNQLPFTPKLPSIFGQYGSTSKTGPATAGTPGADCARKLYGAPSAIIVTMATIPKMVRFILPPSEGLRYGRSRRCNAYESQFLNTPPAAKTNVAFTCVHVTLRVHRKGVQIVELP